MQTKQKRTNAKCETWKNRGTARVRQMRPDARPGRFCTVNEQLYMLYIHIQVQWCGADRIG